MNNGDLKGKIYPIDSLNLAQKQKLSKPFKKRGKCRKMIEKDILQRKYMQLTKLKTDFLEYCELEKGLSQLSIRNYDFYLSRFLKWSGAKKPNQISEKVIHRFRLQLNRYQDEKGHTLSRATQNYHLIALRAFLKYLAKQDIKTLAAEKIELPKTVQREIEALSPEELSALLQAPLETDAPKFIKKRDCAILETLFSTGLRVSELTSLSRDQINLKRDEFTVRGKGNKLRLVFLSEAAKQALREWLALRQDHAPHLFIRYHKHIGDAVEGIKPLTPRSVQRLIKRYALQVGISKKVTPHMMRHTFATDLLRNRADIRSVQKLLGHANISTTQVYTHLADEQLHDVHKKHHSRWRK